MLSKKNNNKPPALAAHEEHCTKCTGTGQVRTVYQGPDENRMYMQCFKCAGSGKRLKCSECGELCNHPQIKHENPVYDTMCNECVIQKVINGNNTTGGTEPEGTVGQGSEAKD